VLITIDVSIEIYNWIRLYYSGWDMAVLRKKLIALDRKVCLTYLALRARVGYILKVSKPYREDILGIDNNTHCYTVDREPITTRISNIQEGIQGV
jgi:hypothetical protein